MVWIKLRNYIVKKNLTSAKEVRVNHPFLGDRKYPTFSWPVRQKQIFCQACRPWNSTASLISLVRAGNDFGNGLLPVEVRLQQATAHQCCMKMSLMMWSGGKLVWKWRGGCSAPKQLLYVLGCTAAGGWFVTTVMPGLITQTEPHDIGGQLESARAEDLNYVFLPV